MTHINCTQPCKQTKNLHHIGFTCSEIFQSERVSVCEFKFKSEEFFFLFEFVSGSKIRVWLQTAENTCSFHTDS